MNLFSTQWAHHVESKSIRRGYYIDRSRVKFRRISTSFSRTFFRCNFDGRKIHVVSTYFFRRNFAGRKIHVVSTYSFRCNLDGRKIHVVSTYFYRCNFAGRKSTLFPRTFFDVITMAKKSMLFPRTLFDAISMVEISTLFLLNFFDVILKGKNSISFLVSFKFKQLTFARFSLKFSSRSSWFSLVPLKFESFNLHHCKKNCCRLVFLIFTEQLLYRIILGQLYCY